MREVRILGLNTKCPNPSSSSRRDSSIPCSISSSVSGVTFSVYSCSSTVSTASGASPDSSVARRLAGDTGTGIKVIVFSPVISYEVCCSIIIVGFGPPIFFGFDVSASSNTSTSIFGPFLGGISVVVACGG